jgi:hypothetical protein
MSHVPRHRKGHIMSTTINGLKVDNITHKNPGNNLPKFVREAAETRGYGDAGNTLSLFVKDEDVAEAFACAAQGNGSSCVMAQAGTRIGAKAVYFYRTTAWIDFGSGPIVRFETSKAIYKNVIAPFDEGDRDGVMPGIYHLTPPRPSKTIAGTRAKHANREHPGGKKKDGSRSVVIRSHTERIVMATHV